MRQSDTVRVFVTRLVFDKVYVMDLIRTQQAGPLALRDTEVAALHGWS